MVKTEDDGELGAEVASRLDELFAEDDEDSASDEVAFGSEKDRRKEDHERPAPEKALSDKEEDAGGDVSSATREESVERLGRAGSPIDRLKAYVTEIEWEITDETMRAFLNEVASLKEKYQDNALLLMCLRMHESIGQYIRVKKVKAHPEGIQLLSSVFSNFEKIVKTPDMPLAQQKQLMAAEVKAFKDFKQKLTGYKRSAKPDSRQTDAALQQTPPGASPGHSAPEMPGTPVTLENREAINQLAEYIVRQLKSEIKDEFEKIRRDLGLRSS